MKMYTNLKKRVLAFVLACSLAIPTGIYLNSSTEVQAATSTLKLKTPKVDDATAKKLFDAMMKGQRVEIYAYNENHPDLYLSRLSARISEKYSYSIEPRNYVDFETRQANNKIVISSKVSKAFAADVKTLQKGVKKPVTSANKALAEQIHKSLYAKKPFMFCTKGKPDKICKGLQNKIKSVNKQGVIFNYEAEKIPQTNDCYKVVIDKDESEDYHYAVKMTEEIFLFGLIWARICAESDYSAKTGCGSSGEIGIEDTLTGETEISESREITDEELFKYTSKAYRNIWNASGMNEVSDIVKLYLIDLSGVFSCVDYTGEKRAIGMSYDMNKRNFYYDEMKKLYEGTAIGMCSDYAHGERVYFSHLGIDVKFVTSDELDHAWTEGVATNSDGKKIKYRFDYGLQSCCPHGKFYRGNRGVIGLQLCTKCNKGSTRYLTEHDLEKVVY